MKMNMNVVIATTPLNGHIAPMMQLATRLAYAGFHVTFLLAKEMSERSQQEAGPKLGREEEEEDLRIVPLWVQVNPGEHGKGGIKALFEAMAKLGPSIAAALSEVEPPPCCIIADYCLRAAEEAAHRLSVPIFTFIPHTAACFSIYHFLNFNQLADGVYVRDCSKMWSIPGLPSISSVELPWYSFHDQDVDFFVNLMVSMNRKWDGGRGRMKGIICNSVYELEKPAMDALTADGVPVLAIGPLCLTSHRENSGLWPWPEETECLKWLDKQAAGSVVYVSFGSTAMFDEKQVNEMALGLEASNRPFLWVLRPKQLLTTSKEGGIAKALPEGFMERVGERCCIVLWAPQKSVLAHPAVGGFLSHCGWNSVIESLSMGVPILAWPYFGDQTLNRLYVAHIWKLGLSFPGTLGTHHVHQGEVENMIWRLMETEEGAQIRDRCKAWRQIIASSISEGGSSCTDFAKLLNELRTTSKCADQDT